MVPSRNRRTGSGIHLNMVAPRKQALFVPCLRGRHNFPTHPASESSAAGEPTPGRLSCPYQGPFTFLHRPGSVETEHTIRHMELLTRQTSFHPNRPICNFGLFRNCCIKRLCLS